MELYGIMITSIWKPIFVLVIIISTPYGIPTSSKKRVCVIGAGIAGLMSAKHLNHYPDEFETIVFEKQSDVGGLWIYSDSTTVDEYGLPVHSSVYKNLRINFPKQLEAFPDYPHFEGNKSMGSFVDHTQMLQYLKNYTKHYNLRQYIKLSTNVENVSPLPGLRWLVATRDLKTNIKKSVECDAMFVGNGNNFKGHIPKLPGIESFPGRVIHSHTYRYPAEFANQTVVILGASFSGIDIGVDVSRFAKEVYISRRHRSRVNALPANVKLTSGVVGAKGSELILGNGAKLKADALILCTGYEYDYPFFNNSTGIHVDGNGKWVRSVYKHLINIEYPTMAILNLPIPSIPCRVPLVQVQYFIAVLRGQLTLPSRAEMLKSAELPAGTPPDKAHYMLHAVFAYYDELAAEAKVDPLSDWYLKSIFAYYYHIFNDPVNFRKKNLHFKKDGSVAFF